MIGTLPRRPATRSERMASTKSSFALVEAVLPHDFEAAALLFREYAAALGVDLCFQNFDAELQQLSRMYGRPSGCLLLVLDGDNPVGCGALRKLSDGICEMKRLYVRSEARGAKLGRRMAERLVANARALGYRAMRLDTLQHMTAAQGLYRSLGFREIAAYYDNPLTNSVYLELDLACGELDA